MTTTKSSTRGGTLSPSDFGCESAGERRREPRLACARRLAVMPLEQSDDTWSFRNVELVDCSASGLGFISGQPMRIGEQFFCKLRMDGIQLILYTVRRCQKMDSEHYRVGAEFSGIIGRPHETPSDALLDRLLNPDTTAE